jgi:hypothetical protein
MINVLAPPMRNFRLGALFWLAFLMAPLLAQQPTTPSPKKDPFEGFGHTGLDQPPIGQSARRGYTLPASNQQTPHVAATPSRSSPAPTPAGTLLDRRPPGARFVTPPPSVSTTAPLASAHGLSFQVKTVASGGETTVKRSAAKEAAPTTVVQEKQSRHPVLEMRVTNLAEYPDTAHFDWFFIARTVYGRRLVIWDQGERDIPVQPHQTTSERMESKDLLAERTRETRFDSTRYDYSDGSSNVVTTPVTSQELSGAHPEGWIVRMFVDGKLAKVQASSPPLEAVGGNPAQLDAMILRPPPEKAQGRPPGLPVQSGQPPP